MGPIERGDGEANPDWSWSFIPGQWSLAEMAMELCDAKPSYVEANLDQWLQDVGTFCPWSARIDAEL